ncbi:MAG: CvpA family protein [Bacteroidales bacterium]|nr:CvpA family protein [Bacteroidales bacterium]
MTVLDIVLLLCLIPGVVSGYTKGFVNQLVDLVAILAGAWAALRFSNFVSQWLANYVTWDKNVLYIVSFIIVVLVVVFILNLIGGLITKALQTVKLGWLNRITGVVLGILKTVVLLAIPVMIFQSINGQFNLVDPEKLNASQAYTFLSDFANTVFPYFKNIVTGLTQTNA